MLINWIINPHKESIENRLNTIGKELDDLCLKYEIFNSETQEDITSVFCTT